MNLIRKESKKIVKRYCEKTHRDIEEEDIEIVQQLILRGIGPGVILSVIDFYLSTNINWRLKSLKNMSHDRMYKFYANIEGINYRPTIDRKLSKIPKDVLNEFVERRLEQIRNKIDDQEVVLIEEEDRLRNILRNSKNEN